MFFREPPFLYILNPGTGAVTGFRADPDDGSLAFAERVAGDIPDTGTQGIAAF